ncbi:MAG TPA: ATP-binding cassette domain-containing protein, partial [Candidatus Limnocylindria bacterium]|nr:ATP-binding cassette domain-containing protein [Candidatus Limnocylindria bacterium]
MIALRHVSKNYAPNFAALKDISFEIDKGEVAFVAGPSGAGKSTLLKLLFREEEASAGEIFINGADVTRLGSRGVARLRRQIGLVFQDFKLLAKLTVVENVALAAEVLGVSKNESRIKAYQLLRELGLKERVE